MKHGIRTLDIPPRALLAGTLCCLLGGVLDARAQKVSKYDTLTLDNLPPVGEVIEAAMDSLPRDVGQIRNWDARMRWAALLPQFQFRFRTYEAYRDMYETVYRTDEGREFISRRDLRTTDRVATDPFDSYVDSYDSRFSDSKRVSYTEGPFANQLPDESQWRDDYQFQATWDLSQLVFHNDELESAQVNRFISEFRLKYMQNVAQIYTKLADALDTLSRTPNNRRAQSQRDIQAAILDEITGDLIYNQSRDGYGDSGASRVSARASSAPALQPAEVVDSGNGTSGNGMNPISTDVANQEAMQGLVPTVATVPGTLADMKREDDQAEEEAEEEEMEASFDF